VKKPIYASKCYARYNLKAREEETPTCPAPASRHRAMKKREKEGKTASSTRKTLSYNAINNVKV
jgi:hypothetical protein